MFNPAEIKCPNCGKSYFIVYSRSSTCMASRPIYKDGVNISHDPNWHFTVCECKECGEIFTVIEKYGEPTLVKKGRRDYCSMDKE